MAKKGLGRGLGSLLPDEDVSPDNNDISFVKLSSIEPNRDQPRQVFDKEKLEILSKSIKENGLIQPITITPTESGRYKIVAGERRWRASKMAGLTEIPTFIKEYTDEQIAQVALIENLQREDLNPIEEALGYKRLLDEFSLTQEMISEIVGKSRSAVANALRLLSLDNSIQKMLISGELSPGHARAVLSIEDKDIRIILAKKIIEDGLNVRQSELLAKNILKSPKKKKKEESEAYIAEIEAISEKITSKLGTKVNIHHSSKKGKIEIEYYGNKDLERILSLLNITL